MLAFLFVLFVSTSTYAQENPILIDDLRLAKEQVDREIVALQLERQKEFETNQEQLQRRIKDAKAFFDLALSEIQVSSSAMADVTAKIDLDNQIQLLEKARSKAKNDKQEMAKLDALIKDLQERADALDSQLIRSIKTVIQQSQKIPDTAFREVLKVKPSRRGVFLSVDVGLNKPVGIAAFSREQSETFLDLKSPIELTQKSLKFSKQSELEKLQRNAEELERKITVAEQVTEAIKRVSADHSRPGELRQSACVLAEETELEIQTLTREMETEEKNWFQSIKDPIVIGNRLLRPLNADLKKMIESKPELQALLTKLSENRIKIQKLEDLRLIVASDYALAERERLVRPGQNPEQETNRVKSLLDNAILARNQENRDVVEKLQDILTPFAASRVKGLIPGFRAQASQRLVGLWETEGASPTWEIRFAHSGGRLKILVNHLPSGVKVISNVGSEVPEILGMKGELSKENLTDEALRDLLQKRSAAISPLISGMDRYGYSGSIDPEFAKSEYKDLVYELLGSSWDPTKLKSVAFDLFQPKRAIQDRIGVLNSVRDKCKELGFVVDAKVKSIPTENQPKAGDAEKSGQPQKAAAGAAK